MSVAIEINPSPVTHSAVYHYLITGLTPTHNVGVNTFSDANATPFAGAPTSGVADAAGNFAGTFTAEVTVGPYVMIVEDKTPNPKQIVALTSFIVV